MKRNLFLPIITDSSTVRLGWLVDGEEGEVGREVLEVSEGGLS